MWRLMRSIDVATDVVVGCGREECNTRHHSRNGTASYSPLSWVSVSDRYDRNPYQPFDQSIGRVWVNWIWSIGPSLSCKHHYPPVARYIVYSQYTCVGGWFVYVPIVHIHFDIAVLSKLPSSETTLVALIGLYCSCGVYTVMWCICTWSCKGGSAAGDRHYNLFWKNSAAFANSWGFKSLFSLNQWSSL